MALRNFKKEICIKGDFAKVDLPTKKEFLKVFGFTQSSFDLFAAEIWANMPEASSGSALACVGYNYGAWKFTFQDIEGDSPGRYHYTDKGRCLAAVALFMIMKIQGEFKGIEVADMKDAGDYDAIAVDAIAQLAVLGEVVYG